MSSARGRDRRLPVWLFRAALAAGLLVAAACRRDATGSASTPSPSASGVRSSVSPVASDRVLARVGDRVITLGDYVAVLNGMDRLDRARYQTPDRRKQLLDEMIDVELLAREAERRGLADRPETKELVRQILRDEVFAELRERQPALEEIPSADVRAYYDAHRADFREPERRRISHLAVRDRALAERLLGEARGVAAKQWGELVRKNSIDKPPPDMPDELAGDLGLVAPPASGKNDNARVPEPLRAAAFEVEKVGDVLGRVVDAGGSFHVVRLTAKSDPRDRSLEEADRTIRVLIAQERLHRAEATLEKDLRARFPVHIDEAALAKVVVPKSEPQK